MSTEWEKNGYEIKGKVAGIEEGKAFLQKYENQKFVNIDSSEIKMGEFEFAGKVDMPDMYTLRIENVKFPIHFFVENTKMTMDINSTDMSATSISGSKLNDVYKLFTEGVTNLRSKMQDVQGKYRMAMQENTLTPEIEQELKDEMNALYEEQSKYYKTAAMENASTIIGPFIATQVMHLFEMEDLENLLSEIPADLKNSELVKAIEEKAETMKKTAIGQPYIDFTLNTPEGKPLSVSDIKAKLLLIDFWAAWCRPCRVENPNVVKLYKEYKSKGLEILGVSFDRNMEDWVKAIKDDGIEWLQVSDLKYWNSEAGKLYGIQSIPATILIDENGIIIAKNLRGEELEAKVAEILD